MAGRTFGCGKEGRRRAVERMRDTFRAAKTICELSGWRISNLPLQKMLYLSHMFHWGRVKQPLIDGRFEAWNLGPVQPDLYHKVKPYGAAPIPDIFLDEAFGPADPEFATIKEVFEFERRDAGSASPDHSHAGRGMG